MKKIARYGIITLILVFLAILGSVIVLADGCCFMQTGCQEGWPYDQAACEAQPGPGVWDENPTCADISQCDEICCCEGIIAHPDSRRGVCQNNNWYEGPAGLDSSGCNTYCTSIVACTPDGCNGVCPSGCTVTEDPDCACNNNDGCCGIGCDDTNDNDCAPACNVNVAGYVYDMASGSKISNIEVYATFNDIEEKSTTTNTDGDYFLIGLNCDRTYRIYSEEAGVYNQGYIDQGVTTIDIFGANIGLNPVGPCDSPNPPAPTITANHVKGVESMNLTWSVACNNINQFSIRRNPERLGGEKTIGSSGSFFVDDEVVWEEIYTYSIRAYYDTGVWSDWSEGVTITLGSQLCRGIFGMELFCLNETYTSPTTGMGAINFFRYGCDDNNIPVLDMDCNQTSPPSVCVGPDEEGSAMCLYKPDDCREIGSPPTDNPYPFGLYYTGASCLDNWCSYDSSSTTIDMCDNCDGKTCYDYKSREACETDNCWAGGIYVSSDDGTNQGCEWIDLFDEFGKGICYDPDYKGTEECSLCGLNADIFYNTGCDQTICSALGSCYSDSGSCLSCESFVDCRDYESQESCIRGQEINFENNGCGGNVPINVIYSNDACGLGVCKWNGASCYKDANDDNVDDCANSPTPKTCNQDTEAPVTIIQANRPNMNGQGYDINFTSDSDAVEFYYCVGDYDCCPSERLDFPLIGYGPKSLQVNPVSYTFQYNGPGIYYIRYYSIDENKNVEEVKTSDFYFDKDPPVVSLDYTTQKVGGRLSILTIRLESDEFISCSYSISPDPLIDTLGSPTKTTDDFGQGDMRRVFELEFRDIEDTSYALITICTDNVGNPDIQVWNLFSPYNLTIYQGGIEVNEIGVGDYIIRIETSELFNSVNVSYNFSSISTGILRDDISMTEVSQNLWQGGFTISNQPNDVDNIFWIGVTGEKAEGSVHTITNTDYRINTIGPSIIFEPPLQSKVYTMEYRITGYTSEPDSTVLAIVYECTSKFDCSLSSQYSGVSESYSAPVKIIDMPVGRCTGKGYPQEGDTIVCFDGDLPDDYGFDAGLTGAPIYYLEFESPVDRTKWYEVEGTEVKGFFNVITYVHLKQPLEEDLGGTYSASAYLTEFASGWFDLTVQLNKGLNQLEIGAIKDGKIGGGIYHMVNSSGVGMEVELFENGLLVTDGDVEQGSDVTMKVSIFDYQGIGTIITSVNVSVDKGIMQPLFYEGGNVYSIDITFDAGEHTAVFYAYDNLSILNNLVSYAISVIDTMGPEIQVVYPKTGVTNVNLPTIRVKTNEAAICDLFLYKANEIDEYIGKFVGQDNMHNLTLPQTYKLSETKASTFNISCVDSIGNSNSIIFDIIWDSSPPYIVSLASTRGYKIFDREQSKITSLLVDTTKETICRYKVYNKEVAVPPSYDEMDNFSDLNYKISNEQDITSDIYGLGINGNFTIYAMCEAKNGLRTSLNFTDINVDIGNLFWMSKSPEGIICNSNPNLVMETNVQSYCEYDDGSGFKPFGTKSVYRETQIYLGQEGNYTYVVRCYLGQGPYDMTNPSDRFEVNLSFTLDLKSALPIINHISPVNGSKIGQNSVKFRENISSSSVCEFSIDESETKVEVNNVNYTLALVNGEYTYTLGSLQDGMYDFTIWAGNSGGFVGSLNGIFEIDTTPPGEPIVIIGAPPAGANNRPVADAGNDISAVIGQVVRLDGNNSFDSDGHSLTYRWRQESGPSADLNNRFIAKPTFVPGTIGEYVFSLVVNDGYIDSEPDMVLVNVREFIPFSCEELSLIIDESYSGTCLDEKYDKIGDIDNDGDIDVSDLASWGLNSDNATWCDEQLADMFDPCADICTDSDGGQDYFVKGTCEDESGEMGDGCIVGEEHDGWLREIICENNQCKMLDYECPTGCESGACIE